MSSADPYSLIYVLFAVKQEVTPFVRALPADGKTALGIGKVNGHDIIAAPCGVGHRLVEKNVRAAIEFKRPSLLIMAGVAGALDPTLNVGDLVIADQVRTFDGVLTPTVIPDGSEFAPAARTGTLLCADRVLVTAAEKKAAYAATSGARSPHSKVPDTAPPPNDPTTQRPNDPPLAVEMETAGLARVAMEHGIPWAAVRAVSDTAEESLPLDFNRLRSADGDLPTSRVALAAMTHPWAIPGLIRLGKNTTVAADALAGFLLTWMKRGLPTR